MKKSLLLAATVAGMTVAGIGAALANPQLSGVALALTPPSQAGEPIPASFWA